MLIALSSAWPAQGRAPPPRAWQRCTAAAASTQYHQDATPAWQARRRRPFGRAPEPDAGHSAAPPDIGAGVPRLPEPRGSAAPADARALNRMITQARDWRQLQRICDDYGSTFDSIHLSAALVRLAALHGCRGERGGGHHDDDDDDDDVGGTSSAAGAAPGLVSPSAAQGPRQLAHVLLQQAAERPEPLTHRQASNAVWAAARLRAAPPPTRLRRLVACAQRRLGFSGFKPQELTNLAYALALLRPHYEAARPLTGALHSRDGSNSSNSSGGGSSSSSGSGSDAPWDESFVSRLFDEAARSLNAFNARDAAQAAYSLCLLRPSAPPGWILAWARRAEALLPSMSSQDLANSAYALARLVAGGGRRAHDGGGGGSGGDGSGGGQEDDVSVARSFVGKCLQYAALRAPSLGAPELIGQLLWAAGQLGEPAAPDSAVRALVGRASALVGVRRGGPGAGAGAASCGGHLALLLQSMGRMGLAAPPVAWQRAYWRAASRHGPRALGGVRLCNMLSGAAALRMRPPPELEAEYLERAAVAAERGDPRLCARVVYCVAAVGWRPGKRWAVRFLAASRPLLRAFAPQDFANSAWALATMGGCPDNRWLDWFLVESLSKLPLFKPQDLANTLWGLAALDHRPTEVWMEQLLGSCLGRLGSFQPRELTSLVWSLARLNYHPGDAWVTSFLEASYSRLPDFRADELASAACALHKLRAAPGTAWVAGMAAAVEAGFSNLDAPAAAAALDALRSLGAAAAAGPEEPPAALALGPFRPEAPGARVVVLQGSEWGPAFSEERRLDAETQQGDRALLQPAGRQLRGGTGAPLSQITPFPSSSPSWLESFIAEAHGMVALMSLMPDGLRRRLRRWPRAWAMRRPAQRGAGGAGGAGALADATPGAVAAAAAAAAAARR